MEIVTFGVEAIMLIQWEKTKRQYENISIISCKKISKKISWQIS